MLDILQASCLQKDGQYGEHVTLLSRRSDAEEPILRSNANLEGATVVSTGWWHGAAVCLHSIDLPRTIQSRRIDPFRIERRVDRWEYTCLNFDREGVEIVQCDNGGAVVGIDVSDTLQRRVLKL
jgi:hypothetical protein